MSQQVIEEDSENMKGGGHMSVGNILGAVLIVFWMGFWGLEGAEIQPSLCFKTVFQFGDSLSDTGNAVIAFPATYGTLTAQNATSSYGHTFFGRPAGRLSDGRLLIDYLAQSMKIPFLEPFLRRALANFSHGVVFSVAYATATNTTLLAEKGINATNPLSLDVQYGWYQEFSRVVSLGTLPQRLPTVDAMKKALYLAGEIGQNDYYFALRDGQTIAQVMDIIVPTVIRSILDLIERLYNDGGRNFLVFSSPPGGCSPLFRTEFNGSRDSYGCLADYNRIYELHRTLLKRELQTARFLYTDAQIIFADYFDAYMNVLNDREKYGLKNTQSACCGAAGSPHNYDPSRPCSQPGSRICNNASQYIYWDERHFTDAFNNIIASKFVSGQYLNPSIQLYCQL